MSPTRDDVLTLEDQRWAAVIDKDFDTLEAMIHPDLTYTHSNAMVDTKKSWLDSMRSGTVDYQAVTRKGVAMVTSEKAAIITGEASLTVLFQGHEIILHSRFTSVWVNEDGTWLFFGWQNTPMPKQP